MNLDQDIRSISLNNYQSSKKYLCEASEIKESGAG